MKNLLEEINSSTVKFLTPLNLETTYKIITEEAMRLIGGNIATIFLAEGGRLKRAYSTSSKLSKIEPRQKGFTYRVYKNQKVIILSVNEIEKIHPEIKDTKIKYDILIPLVNRGRSFGVLSILSNKRKFSKADMATMGLFTPLASLAIRKAQLYKELNSAVETRDLFISMASHELKTPVTTMYIYMQLLKSRSKKGKAIDPKWIDTLLSEMTRLIKLINELLQVNQIRTGDFKYEWEELNIIDVIKNTTSSIKTSHAGSRIIFNNNTRKRRIMMIGDPNKLSQVIINLLDNSLKHNVDGAPVNINLGINKKTIEIQVQDKGRGISQKDLGNVFNEFYKGEGHTKSGMGLGLFLIKKIIEKHKGKIEIKSTVGTGTNVKISLPILKYARN